MTNADLNRPVPRRTTLSGTRQLAPGRAMSLTAHQPSLLKLVEGGLWVTLQGPYGLSPDNSGDQFLLAGQELVVPAGQRLVMEPHGGVNKGSAWFCWDPVVPAGAHSLATVAHWRVGVAQPLADLRVAAVLGLGAVARLAVGLVFWAGAALRRRGDAGLTACACSAQSRA